MQESKVFTLFLVSALVFVPIQGYNGSTSSLLSTQVLQFVWNYFDHLNMNILNFITCGGNDENLRIMNFVKNITENMKTVKLHKDARQVGNLSSFDLDVENGYITRIDCLIQFRPVLTPVSYLFVSRNKYFYNHYCDYRCSRTFNG